MIRNDGSLEELEQRSVVRELVGRIARASPRDVGAMAAARTAQPALAAAAARAARAIARRRRRSAVARLVAGVGVDRQQRSSSSDAIREVTLPLRHEDIIRQQAREKGVAAGPDRRGDLRASRASATRPPRPAPGA